MEENEIGTGVYAYVPFSIPERAYGMVKANLETLKWLNQELREAKSQEHRNSLQDSINFWIESSQFWLNQM